MTRTRLRWLAFLIVLIIWGVAAEVFHGRELIYELSTDPVFGISEILGVVVIGPLLIVGVAMLISWLVRALHRSISRS